MVITNCHYEGGVSPTRDMLFIAPERCLATIPVVILSGAPAALFGGRAVEGPLYRKKRPD